MGGIMLIWVVIGVDSDGSARMARIRDGWGWVVLIGSVGLVGMGW